jgi:hypothetical protein
MAAWNLDVEIPAQLSQNSSYVADLSRWLAGKAPQGTTWWIILDGLAKLTSPDPGLLDFLMAFAKHLARNAPTLRLVLLDFGVQHALPTAAETMTRKVAIDKLTSRDMVEHYFRALHLAHDPRIPFDEVLMLNKAEWVLQQVSAQAGSAQQVFHLKELLLQVTNELGLGG